MNELVPQAAQHCILVVDDDLLQRELMRSELELSGFQVCLASSANEAYGILQNHGSSIDAVVSDLHMPNGSGLDLLRRMRASGTATPFYLVDTDEKASELATGAGINGFLKKPFRIERLAIKLWLLFKELEMRQAFEKERKAA